MTFGMAEKIFGARPQGTATPADVRDAMVRCFLEAHSDVLDDMKSYGRDLTKEEFEQLKKTDVEGLIKKFFVEAKGSFENPDKESLMKVMDMLRDYAAHFRDKGTIDAHYSQIRRLVQSLP